MIRTIITTDQNDYTIKLPDNFLGKRIEVIAFVIDEDIAQPLTKKETKRTFSAIQLDTRGFKFNRDEANER